ncbi:hypothetical protein SBC1_78100 (plasmid) [Caballeronia sp. SBC1]|nr:hypothetical protein SBC2_81320 [Caballeronia sp. SBC2]QIN67763.1 hypothetical protein SBC1_78100 [Caballeronia sp. SBC1]
MVQGDCFLAGQRDEAQVKRELSRLVALIGLVHQQVQWPIRRPDAL